MAKYTDFLKLWKSSDVFRSMKAAGVENKDILNIRKNLYNANADEDMLSDVREMFSGVGNVRHFASADRNGIFRGASKETQNILATKLADAERIQQVEADASKRASLTLITDHDIAKAQEESIKEGLDFQAAARANSEIKNAEELNQFKQDPVKMQIAQNLNIDVNTVNGRNYVEQYMDHESNVYKLARARAEQQESAKTAKAVSAGSGQSIQEAAVPKETWSDTEKGYGIKDLDFNGTGGLSIDEAILRQKIGGDRKNWGFQKAADRRLKNVMEQVQQDHEAVMKSNMSQEEKQALWTKKRKEAADLLAEGPDIADYAFGNNLHYKGLGFAAMIGTMNVAFGGAKSNAQLYSSPF